MSEFGMCSKRRVKRPIPNRDYASIDEHYRRNTIADLAIYNEEKSVIRSEDKKHKQAILKEEQEKELEYRLFFKVQEKEEKKKIKEEKERAEAQETKKQIEEIRDSKLREKLRSESLEIRELQAKLDAAYMNKVRSAQIAQHEADRKARDDEADEYRRFVDSQTADAVRAKQEARIAKIEGARKLHQDLENQLLEKEKNAQLAYELFQEEKLKIDDVVEKIRLEDEKRREDDQNRIKNDRAFMAQKKLENELRDAMEKQRNEEEDRKNKEFEEQMQMRAKQIQVQKQNKADSLDSVQRHLRQELTKTFTEKKDYEKLIQDLAMSELEEQQQQKEKCEAEQKVKLAIERKNDHFMHLQLKQERLDAEKAEEDEIRHKMMAKYAEDDRIELMNAQKRRMKQLEHKKCVEIMLAERREMLAKERSAREAERQRELDDQERMRQLIEEERQKLLKKHAEDLLGFLPKGVIRNEEDLQELGPEYRKSYAPKPVPEEDEL